MIALKLPEVKECMSKLLLSDAFDSFLFIEGEIVTYNTFSINGFLKKDFLRKTWLLPKIILCGKILESTHFL